MASCHLEGVRGYVVAIVPARCRDRLGCVFVPAHILCFCGTLQADLLVPPITVWTSTTTVRSAEALGPLRVLSTAVSSLHVLVPSLTLAIADTISDGGTLLLVPLLTLAIANTFSDGGTQLIVPFLTSACADTTSDGGTSAADDVWSARAESVYVVIAFVEGDICDVRRTLQISEWCTTSTIV